MSWRRRLLGPRPWRRIALALGALILAGIGLVALADWRIASAGAVVADPDQLPAGRVALVLGTSPRLRTGGGNPWFLARMDAAAALWRSGRVRALLVSGDNRRHDYDEPTWMREALIARGVPAAAIHRDYAGLRTLDSVVRAKAVFGQTALIIVSQADHAERALYLARAHGIDAAGFAAADPGYVGPRQWLRERLARVRCLLDVHLLDTGPRHLGEPVVIDPP